MEEKKILGRVHSTESFGTVDGPGIRYVIFMQGCPLRCLYCHNPDTWSIQGGREMSVSEVMEEFEKNRFFYSKGGITVTGGEPLLQIDFLIELFREAHSRGIHTAIDTSGITYTESNPSYIAKLDELMKYTSLVMLDIKHIKSDAHRRLTGADNKNILAFARYLDKRSVPIWARHVVLEGYTDGEEDLFELGKFLGSLKNLKALDVLPYHTMGKAKYEELGIPYKLEGIMPLDKSKAAAAKEIILRGIFSARAAKG